MPLLGTALGVQVLAEKGQLVEDQNDLAVAFFQSLGDGAERDLQIVEHVSGSGQRFGGLPGTAAGQPEDRPHRRRHP